MIRLLALLLASVLALVGTDIETVAQQFTRGGASGPGGGVPAGPAFACDAALTGVCADHANGQTFLQWPDARVAGTCNGGGTGTYCTDVNKRYRTLRATVPLNAVNCLTSGTVIGRYHPFNSGQYIGGNPAGAGAAYTPNNRKADDAVNVMTRVPDAQNSGTKLLAYATGLQVYKAVATEDAYYCVVSTDTGDANPSYIGSVGPIGEAAATQEAVPYVLRTSGQGWVNGTLSNAPIVLALLASSSAGGPPGNSTLGDCWAWFGDATESWQAGQQRQFCVFQDQNGTNSYPSLSGGSLVLNMRDEMWNTLVTGSLVSDYYGLGLRPLNGTPNRFYPTTMNAIDHMLTWVAAHYNGDIHKIHSTGYSAGGIGQALITTHNSPVFASAWLGHPILRWDAYSSGSAWGGVFWSGTVANPSPFMATVHDAPAIFGTDATAAAAIQFADNSSWLTYATFPGAVQNSPGTDMPFFGMQTAKDDVNYTVTGPESFSQYIETKDALQAAHRGHAMTWFMGGHDTTLPNMGAINCDLGANSVAGVCYPKSLFATNLHYVAFDHSSIDDDMGSNARDAANIANGDTVGCVNCGFTWNVTADTSSALNFTIGNVWMTRAATPVPVSATSGTMTTTSTTVTVTDDTFGAKLQTVSVNPYFKIGSGAGAEIVKASSVSAGTLTIALRGYLNTTAKTHGAGEPITQYVVRPAGPNVGPQATMTVNVTPRRAQSFVKANGVTVTCSITPSGDPTTTQTPTVINNLWTLTNVTIKANLLTTINCG